MAKDIEFGLAALSEMQKGTQILGDAVGESLGPYGKNVVLQSGSFGEPKITKDGVTIAREVNIATNTHSGSMQNTGATLIKVAANKTNEIAGDGTTTSTVLAVEAFKQLTKQVAAGRKPVLLKSGVDKAVQAVIEELKNHSVPCTDNKSITNVGTISANSDPIIGKIIADAMDAVGPEGVITVEEGSTFKDNLKVVEGMQFDRGYLSPYFVTNQQRIQIISSAYPSFFYQ